MDHKADHKALLLSAALGALLGAHAVALASWARGLFLREEEEEEEEENSRYMDEALALSKEEVLALRRRHFCAAQSVSYENTSPLMAVLMEGQRVEDDAGVSYLDSRNNVGHVGWQHPRVVRAVQRQQARCNANSRYVHGCRGLLAKKLLATFPGALGKGVVFFVNSGSEANDLALRIARVHTGARDAIVVDRAYHGHTAATLSISPYKYEHAGGEGYAEDWVHKVACPDLYRGAHRDSRTAAALYAAEVEQACRACRKRSRGGGGGGGGGGSGSVGGGGGGVAAFFIESGMSVAGVILPPEGYLQKCYRHVRAAGGVCVADEVQTGFGRFGSSFWGFEQQGVVPDIVTMGKPFGNGFPLAAVVTTRAVAESFANGLEYFNTFGGNPVACAAGLAVLETVEREGLQAHAAEVGAHLMGRLRREAMGSGGGGGAGGGARDGALFCVGDVRGSGLFIGIEFVRDVQTRSPATLETSLLCSRLKDAPHRILTSIDGRHDNVIVIKPPMCFGKKDADTLVDAILEIMPAITEEDVRRATHTST